MKRLLGLLFILSIGLTSCTNNYSTGERVGIITKFSEKGLLFKTWEGDLKVAPNIANGNGMVGQYEDFYFSVDNDNTIKCITSSDSINEYMKEGIPVIITYQQVKGFNWFMNRGETDYFIKVVNRTN